MTLHEAIAQVLRENGGPMTTREVADAVNRGQLYRRTDGKPVPVSQISARVNNYFRMFKLTDGKIALIE